MDDNAFFKTVWRFNALAIAGVAIIGGLLSAYTLLQVLRYETRNREVTNVVDTGADERLRDDFVLGFPSKVAGLEIVRIPLLRSQTRDLGSYSKGSSGNEVNFLFLNTATNTSAWMSPNINQLFLNDIVLVDKISPPAGEKQTAAGIFFAVVESDTNGDKKLTQSDLVTLAFCEPDGKNYRKLTDGIERVFSIDQISSDRLLVIYQKGDATISELYSVPELVSISQKTIPKVDLK